jgi:hypothetical protein
MSALPLVRATILKKRCGRICMGSCSCLGGGLQARAGGGVLSALSARATLYAPDPGPTPCSSRGLCCRFRGMQGPGGLSKARTAAPSPGCRSHLPP